MRKMIVINIDNVDADKARKLYNKLNEKYGGLVRVYQSGDEEELCCRVLDLFPYSDWSEISAKIKSKYLKNSGGV